jgi:hypothetical protein
MRKVVTTIEKKMVVNFQVIEERQGTINLLFLGISQFDLLWDGGVRF